MLLLLGCEAGPDTPDTPTDTSDTSTDTSDTSTDTSDTSTDTSDTAEDTDPPPPVAWLIARDPASDASLSWQAFFGPDAVLSDADADIAPGPDDLVVFLPDLGRNADDDAVRLTSHGGPVLGLGVGGARAYDGLGIGMGASDGGQGEVDAMAVAEDARDHAVFAGVALPEDGVVTVTTSDVTDIGIHRPGSEITVLGWDYRYPGEYADLCYTDRYWYWGWGSDRDGAPDALTDDGATILRAVVAELLPS